MKNCHHSPAAGSQSSRTFKWVFAALGAFALIGAAVLLRDRASSFNWTWLVLLACPLVHLLLCRHSHGAHSNDKPATASDSRKPLS